MVRISFVGKVGTFKGAGYDPLGIVWNMSTVMLKVRHKGSQLQLSGFRG